MTTDVLPKPDAQAAVAAAVTIVVCATCRRAGAAEGALPEGPALFAATRAAAAGTDIAVRSVSCLSNCSRGLSAAVLRPGAFTYVFGMLDAETGGPALVEGAEMFAAADAAVMPWRGRPEQLKRGLVARVPPLDLTEETP